MAVTKSSKISDWKVRVLQQRGYVQVIVCFRAMRHFQSLDYRAATVEDDDSLLDTVHQNTITYDDFSLSLSLSVAMWVVGFTLCHSSSHLCGLVV